MYLLYIIATECNDDTLQSQSEFHLTLFEYQKAVTFFTTQNNHRAKRFCITPECTSEQQRIEMTGKKSE